MPWFCLSIIQLFYKRLPYIGCWLAITPNASAILWAGGRGGQFGRPRAGLPAWQSSRSHPGARVCRQLLCDQSEGQIVDGSSPPKESGVRAVLVWLGPARKSLLSSVLRHQRAPKPGPVGGLTSGRQAAPSPFTDGALNTSFGAHQRACGILVP